MAYRNRTFVSFASEDILSYRLMQAWKANEHIDFDFNDAHDINTALDTSHPDTIRQRLRERLANTKQVVLLAGDATKSKAANSSSFLYYEVEVIQSLGLPVVIANVNGSRLVQSSKIPSKLGSPLYTVSVSLQPAIIKYALDKFPDDFHSNENLSNKKVGPHQYPSSVYEGLGL
ncbi:MAG: TIR domain-containing protein [Coriobacteriia bacterium]|nr:TIR domain-containing protein [Coriobacteriia bacterium]